MSTLLKMFLKCFSGSLFLLKQNPQSGVSKVSAWSPPAHAVTFAWSSLLFNFHQVTPAHLSGFNGSATSLKKLPNLNQVPPQDSNLLSSLVQFIISIYLYPVFLTQLPRG